ncbi:PsiF family protein [Rhodoblastus sp. 17X3]|uniref:PsiF family protein n=1 Tax=Rhodoblastus sp. 17X3 TaxID=3047026 RepID=UPI0024B6A075|nr:PsiF family protein [Rhodoblastus sp. 17X3]MDI9850276.1 PsiF family protein [Rhodoblastus sp. 17X3]
MKLNRIFPLAGVLTLLAGAAFAQANIPAGAGAGVYRPAPGAPVGGAVNPRPAAPPAAAPRADGDANKQAVSKSCSQQADAQGLHGKARKTFREKCKRSGGR